MLGLATEPATLAYLFFTFARSLPAPFSSATS
jgi:hypothetical protein